jgi:hypothetical protein
MSISSVHFISDPDVKNVSRLQAMAHVFLLPLRKGAGMSSIPSKLPAYLFSAKPVLATVDDESDTAHCLREAQCGWVGEPENVEWLGHKMGEVSAMRPVELDEMGKRGRAYGLEHFSKARGVRLLADLVISCARPSNGTPNN